MSQSKLPTTQVSHLPNSCDGYFTSGICALHVFDREGHRRQLNASSGIFSYLYLSRPGIIGLLTPAVPLDRPGVNSDHPNGLHAPGLFIICTDKFDKDSDWVLAVQEDGGSDPGWRFERVLGRHQLGSGESLWSSMHAAMLALGNEVRFVRYKLPGGFLGDPGL